MGMFDKPTAWVSLPIEDLTLGFERQVHLAIDYYGRSKARHCIVIALRLQHLLNLSITYDTNLVYGMDLFMTSKNYGLMLLQKVWEAWRSPTYGLNKNLLDAMKVTRLAKNLESRVYSDTHHQKLVDELEHFYDALESLFASNEKMEQMEFECIRIMQDNVNAGGAKYVKVLPKREQWMAQSLQDRKDLAHKLITEQIVPCGLDIETLAAAECMTQDWTEEERERRANWSTSDETLRKMTAAKSVKQPSTVQESVSFPKVVPPKMKRR